MNKEKIKNKNMIENLKKEIDEKNKILMKI